MIPSPGKRSGFTLIEMLVVISIIITLAAILVPLLFYGQSKAQAARCGSYARAIGVAVTSYAPNWKGWTNPDGSYYVKEFGYKLSNDPGYVAAEAQKVRQFKCPLDTKPFTNGHGYPCSYSVSSAYVGTNLMTNLTDSAISILVMEVGKRHQADGKGMEKHYVFGDTHVELGWKRGFIPGLYGRWWNESSGNWGAVQAETYNKLPDYETVWTKDLTESSFGFLPQTGKPGNWGKQSGTGVDNILVRFDGYIEFPAGGDWHVVSSSDEWVYIWIDGNGDASASGAETAQYLGPGTVFLKSFMGVNMLQKYKFVFMYLEGGSSNYFNLYWSQDVAVVSNPNSGNKTLIPSSALSHIP